MRFARWQPMLSLSWIICQVVSGTSNLTDNDGRCSDGISVALWSREPQLEMDPWMRPFKAISQIVDIQLNLIDYQIRSVTEGEDAIGEQFRSGKVQDNGNIITGHGASTDIIEASARLTSTLLIS